MPRDSNGDYTLPAGNPVVTSTVISSSWANNTLSDLATAMTDSLSRSGDGAMLAPLELTDGAAGAPGLNWGTETTSGLYRQALNTFRFSVSGTDQFQFDTGGVGFKAGAAATPSIHPIGDPNTGIWASGADVVDVATGGTNRLSLSTTTFSISLPVLASAGSVSDPSYSFSGDPNTGIYSNAGDSVRFTAGGVDVAQISSGGAYFLDGTAAAPSISFLTDTNTGVYSASADTIGFTTAGTRRGYWNSTELRVESSRVSVNDGSAGTPSVAFGNDTDTGLFIEFGGMSVTVGGTRALLWDSNRAMRATDGNLTTPSYSFFDDADTGIFRSAANTCAVSHGGVAAPIGYRDGARGTFPGNLTTDTSHAGRVLQYSGTGGHTLTVTTTGVPESMMITVIANNSLTMTPTSGTMYWFNGSGTLTTGNRTLAGGGVCVLLINSSVPDVYVWGTGIT